MKKLNEIEASALVWLFPELRLFDSNSRGDAFQEATVSNLLRRPVGWLLPGFLWVLFSAAALSGHYSTWRDQVENQLGTLGLWVVYIVSAVFIGFLVTWVFRVPIRRRLRELLAERGVPICIPCGYDLRALTEPRCPECGTAFDEQLLKDQA